MMEEFDLKYDWYWKAHVLKFFTKCFYIFSYDCFLFFYWIIIYLSRISICSLTRKVRKRLEQWTIHKRTMTLINLSNHVHFNYYWKTNPWHLDELKIHCIDSGPPRGERGGGRGGQFAPGPNQWRAPKTKKWSRYINCTRNGAWKTGYTLKSVVKWHESFYMVTS